MKAKKSSRPEQAAVAQAEVVTIIDSRAARILVDPDELRWFAPFMARDCTVSNAALETGAKLNTMFSRVRRYSELDLLRVVREEARNGRVLRVYRSSADTYFVPHTLSGDAEETKLHWALHQEQMLARAQEEALQRELPRGGTRVYRDQNGILNSQLARNAHENMQLLEPNAPAVFCMFHDAVFLDFQDAKRFQRELDALVKRYTALGGGQRYAVKLKLVPLPEGTNTIS